jgi:hypothetical protein
MSRTITGGGGALWESCTAPGEAANSMATTITIQAIVIGRGREILELPPWPMRALR